MPCIASPSLGTSLVHTSENESIVSPSLGTSQVHTSENESGVDQSDRVFDTHCGTVALLYVH